MNICPNCENVLKGDRPEFCDQCGCDLSRQIEQQTSSITNTTQPKIDPANLQGIDPSTTPEQKEAVFLEKMKAAMKDGNLPLEDIPKLSALRQELGISMERAKELFDKAVQSFRPTQQDDLEDKPKGHSYGLALHTNVNRFYMEGFRGVLDIKLENLSDTSFDSVKVEVSGDLLAKTEYFSTFLEPCREINKKFSVKPSDPGVNLVQFRVNARCGEQIYAFWAEEDFPVFRETKDLRQISIQAEKFIDNSIADNSKNMGNAVKNQIGSLLSIGKIKDANDLMREFRNLTPLYKTIRLEYDPKRSEELKNSLTISVCPQAPAKRIVKSDRGSLTDTASLHIESKEKPVNAVLIAKPTVTIGRARKYDIIARVLPRSAENDPKSLRISAEPLQCQLDLTEKGLFIKDIGSPNGTTLDGKNVGSKGGQIDAKTKELELAGVFALSIKWCNSKQGPKDTPYEESLADRIGQLWKVGTKAGINSITLERINNLGIDDWNGSESYCLIYRMATVGSGNNCSIQFADKGLESVHAAILYLADRFYLENLTDLTDVTVNDTTISKNELMPLSFGDRIRIARLDMKFLQKYQLFIDSIA